MYTFILVFLAAVSGALSQVVLINGTCPITSGSTGVLSNIQGTWYQIERITHSEELGDCSTTFFNENVTSISNREVVSQRAVVNNGTITRPNNQTYRFTVTFSGQLPRDYYLVGTNFQNYAVLARCQETTTNNGTTTSLYAWKLSRNTSLTLADTVAINVHLAAVPALATATWRTTSHSTEACRTSAAGSAVPSLVALVAALLFAAKGNC